MTAEQKVMCEEWVKAHVMSWQVLNRAQWKYKFHPKTLVRYIEEASMREDEVRLLLEYLSSDDSIGTLSLYDQTVEGYKPTKAWYEMTNRVQAGVRGVRLYQALTDNINEDDGLYVVEDGCAWKVEHTFIWDSDTIPAVEPSTSGVMYRITNLRRDEETGLYSYIKEKRTRVTQEIKEYVRECSVFSSVSESALYGVKADDVDSAGVKASAEGGVVVERKVTKNEDCTSDVTNVKTTEIEVENAVVVKEKRRHAVIKSVTHKNQKLALTDDEEKMVVGETRKSQKTPGGLYDNVHETIEEEEVGVIGTGCEKTLFAHEHEVLENKNDMPTGDVDEPVKGTIKSRSARQTEYGTWDITEKTITELPVVDSAVSYRKTLRGTVSTTENKNQEKPLNDTNIKIGETRESKKTPGGLYDNSVTTTTAIDAGEIGCGEEKTKFVHEDHTLTNVVKKPTGTVNEAGGGVIKSKVLRQTDIGTWDITETTKTEKPVANANVTYRKTLRGKLKTTENRNSGQIATGDVEVGETESHEMTPGGLYNYSKTSVMKESVGEIGCGEEKTKFVHEDHTLTNVAEKPQDTTVNEASGGVIKSKVLRQTDTGTWDITETTKTEKPVANANVTYRKTLRGKLKTTENRNSEQIATGDVEFGETESHEMTPGGLYNYSKTTVAPESVGTIAESNNEDWFSKQNKVEGNSIRNELYTMAEALEETAKLPDEMTPGTIVVKSANVTEYGTIDSSTSTITAKDVVHDWEWDDHRGEHKTYWYRNKDDEELSELKNLALYDKDTDVDGNYTFTVSWTDRVNEFGLHDGSLDVTKAERVYGRGGSGDSSSSTDGAVIEYGELRRGQPKRVMEVRRVQLQVKIRRGGLVTAYDNQVLNSLDPDGIVEDGLIAIKPISGTYKTESGIKMDWAEAWVVGVGRWEKWNKDSHKDLSLIKRSLASTAREIIKSIYKTN